MWIAPTMRLYGQRLVPPEPLQLLEPGVFYLGTALVAALAGCVVGLERLFARLPLPRWAQVVVESGFWVSVILGLSHFASKAARGQLAVVGPDESLLYLVLHVVLLVACFRRLYGLLLPAFAPGKQERRAQSSWLRLLHGAFAAGLLFAQVQLAVIFGALGPNPERRVRPVRVTTRALAPCDATSTGRELLFVYETSSELVAVDPTTESVLKFPKNELLHVETLRYSERQVALLDMLETGVTVDHADIFSLFPVRAAIVELELRDLEEQEKVRRAGDGYLLEVRSGARRSG
jgi:hypothetical protein